MLFSSAKELGKLVAAVDTNRAAAAGLTSSQMIAVRAAARMSRLVRKDAKGDFEREMVDETRAAITRWHLQLASLIGLRVADDYAAMLGLKAAVGEVVGKKSSQVIGVPAAKVGVKS